MNIIETIKQTSEMITSAKEKYDNYMGEAMKIIGQIEELPNLVETKSIEYIEAEQVRLTDKFTAIINKGKEMLSKKVEAAKEQINKAIEEQKTKYEETLKAETEAISQVVEAVTSGGMSTAAAMAEQIKTKAEQAIEITNVVSEATEAANDVSSILSSVTELIPTVTGVMSTLSDIQDKLNAKGLISDSTSIINNVYNKTTESLTNIYNDSVDKVKGYGNSINSSISGSIQGVIGIPTSILEDASATAQNTIMKFIKDTLGGMIGDDMLLQTIMSTATTYGGSVLADYVKQYTDHANSIINDTLSSVTDKINETTSGTINNITETASGLIGNKI